MDSGFGWERTMPAISCIIVCEKGDGDLGQFIAPLNHRVGAGSVLGACLMGRQRPCLTGKSGSDCEMEVFPRHLTLNASCRLIKTIWPRTA